MKRLFTIFIALVVSSSISASAQQTESKPLDKVLFDTNPFKGNWFVQLGAGALYFNGNYDTDMRFGNQIAPSADLFVGKWLAPTIGVRAGVHGLFLNTHSSTESPYAGLNESGATSGRPDWTDSYGQRYYNTNIHADALFNVTNMICGYSDDRVYEFIPYAGVGLMQGYKDNKWTDIAFDLGLLNNFNISKRFNLYVDIAAVAFKNEYSGRGVTRDFTVSATAGLSYKFSKQVGWLPVPAAVPSFKKEYEDLQKKYTAQSNELDESIKRHQEQQEELENAINELKKKLAEVGLNTPELLITFKIGSAELNNLALVNISNYAKSIKSTTESGNKITFAITGYADKFTGSESFNNKLSQERAEAVKSLLVDEFGVAEDSVEVKFEGGVDNMFYDDRTLSRSVILAPVSVR